jgi:cation diffusion facilitator CzcD-associated flavoprotein CzcO
MRTRHYGAIVIGGGIIGWSTAYHLQQQGVHDIANSGGDTTSTCVKTATCTSLALPTATLRG